MLVEQLALLGLGQAAAEVLGGLDDQHEERRVRPVEGLGVQRMIATAFGVDALDGLVKALDLLTGLRGAFAVVNHTHDRIHRARDPLQGSRSRIEWSSTPAPSSGYMFWIAPIHTPSMPVRRSPKYFHVSESGAEGPARCSAVLVERHHSTIMLTTHVVYDFGRVAAHCYAPAIGVPHARDQPVCRSIAGRGSGHVRWRCECRVVRGTSRRYGEIDGAPDRPAPPLRPSGPMGWLKDTNHSPAVIAFLRRARRALPGDPDSEIRCPRPVLVVRAPLPGPPIGAGARRRVT